jgi:hypothetical protein
MPLSIRIIAELLEPHVWVQVQRFRELAGEDGPKAQHTTVIPSCKQHHDEFLHIGKRP